MASKMKSRKAVRERKRTHTQAPAKRTQNWLKDQPYIPLDSQGNSHPRRPK